MSSPYNQTEPDDSEAIDVIFPCLESEYSALSIAQAIESSYVGHGVEFRFFFVSDGSKMTDLSGFATAVQRGIDAQASHLILPKNLGKASAIRTGFAESTADVVVFCDSDGDIPASEILMMIEQFRQVRPKMCYAERHAVEAKARPFLRKFATRALRLLSISLRLIPPNINETQVGVKVVDSRVLAQALELLPVKRFGLDLALFAVVTRSSKFDKADLSRREIRTNNFGSSSIRLRAIVQTLFEVFIIWFYLVLRPFDEI